ncbi:MAG TPA: branched-chain amino acid ABC transporter permease [Candidatus Acidoferrales bacterium]|nr:branched-chain amino acid ABC transporter permease [Candidatus Acidoferrales bacterium]
MKRVLVSVAVVLAMLIPVIVHQQVYVLFVVAEFFVFAIVALSLDLLLGRSGQISLGQSGFFAVGAYTAALLNVRFGWEIVSCICGAAIVASLSSLILGLPATRLRGHYLGIVTLGFGIGVAQIALTWSALTGGDEGIHLAGTRLLFWSFADPSRLYYLCFAGLVAVVFGMNALGRSRIGRSFAAVRDSEIAAAAMGIPVARTKVLAFVFSAALAGAGGALFAFLNGFIAPEDFGFSQTLLFFAMVVLGGMSSTAGVICGTFVVQVVEQSAATVSGLSLTLLGAAIVAAVLFLPGGIASLGERIGPWGGGWSRVRAREPRLAEPSAGQAGNSAVGTHAAV